MAAPLRLLLIEDSSDDAALMVREIQRGGYNVEYQRVETEAALRAALEQEQWDLILCDYTLPAFNAVRALELLKASGQDLPFIIASGSIGEEMAVAALRNGAHDFVLKGSLARLVPAIQRELAEAETRRERRRAEEDLRNALKFFETVIETANVIFLQLDSAGNVVKINSTAEEITGYKRNELQGMNWGDKLVPKTRYPMAWQEFDRITKAREEPAMFENPILTRQGEERHILWKNSVLREGEAVIGTISFGIDITERKRADAALRDAEARYRLLVERIPAVTYVISAEPPFRTLYISPQVEQMLGFSPEEWISDPDLWERQVYPEDLERVLAEDKASRAEKRPFNAEYRIRRRDGRVIWLHDETHHVSEPGVAAFSQGIEIDITERKQAEEALREAESRYRILVEQLPMVVYMNVADQAGHNTYVSPQIESVLGYTPQQWTTDPNFWESVLHPDDHDAVLKESARVNVTGEPFDMEYRSLTADGRVVWLRDQAVCMKDAAGHPTHWQGLMIDVTQNKQREREWEAIARLSKVLRDAQTVKEILPRLLDETLFWLDTDQGSVWLRDPSSGEIINSEQRRWGNEPLSNLPFGAAILSAVIYEGQSIVGREFHTDPRIPEEQRRHIPPGIGGASVPLAAAGKNLGALFVNVRLPHEITADELRVLNALADLGANAIHRAQLFEETVKHLDRMAALRSIDIAISSSFDLRMILNVVLDKVTKELHVDAASILLLKPESLILEFAAGNGFWTRSIESSSVAVPAGLPSKAVLERKSAYVEDLRTLGTELTRPFLVTEEKFISYYGVPLLAKGKVKGVLEIFNRSQLTRDAEWMQFLEALAGQTAIAIDSSGTFQDLQRSNMDLALAYDATIEGWSHALDLRDKETEGHTLRVTEVALKLARRLGMEDEALVHLRRGGLLHDIGKMGVPDSILLKPGKLTDEEWSVMRQHPQLAYDMLTSISYLRPALLIPYSHHEKWDGSGYPRGLKGEEIPLVARIFGIVDVWDALNSDRPYRPAWNREKVIEYMREQSGKHFDPSILETFLELLTEEISG